MRVWVRPLLVLIFLVVIPFPVWSIIVETRDGKFYYGHLVEMHPLRVTIRLEGQNLPVIVKRANIKGITRALDERRLRDLKPAQLAGYWNYALELAAQKADPEARDGAIRLFLICAYQNPEKYGYTSLLRMSRLGRNETETKTFRAMAFLLDLLRDKKTLKKNAGGVPVGKQPVADFLKSLEYLRRGKTSLALKHAQKPGVSEYFDAVPGLMSYKKFQEICAANPECAKCNKKGRLFCKACGGGSKTRNCAICNGKGWTVCSKCAGRPRRVHLSPFQMQLFLKLELLSAKNPKAGLTPPDASKAGSWSKLLSSQGLQPVPVFSLLYVTEFDPRANVFSKGKWVRSGK